ncbi:MAG TPA: amino acid--tRNA ligase-related protein, partial [Brumimicrobium sp.]|nr:amino acid--tRNA ligase-related protein [Brumimicrobium sp.]
MKHTKIRTLLESPQIGETVVVKGWVRAFRSNRFIQINDGSTINNIQIVVEYENFDEAVLDKIHTATALEIQGKVVESEGKGQAIEIAAATIKVIGEANPDDVQKTVLQPKRHSLEFLREQAHLRFRTNVFGAVFRIRHGLTFAIHKFFNDKGFYNVHTPILTTSDAEGAGEMFHVTNFDLNNIPKTEDGKVDYSKDFFEKAV